MKHLGNALTAIASTALAGLLLASPVSAQTSGTANNPPGAYGNSGSTAAGPGTGATGRYNDKTPSDNGGGWGIWGLVGLLGLFGMGYSARGRVSSTYREEMPRSGRANEVNTITDEDVPTNIRS